MSNQDSQFSIPIFITGEQQCSYFDDKTSITAFVDPKFILNEFVYTKLSELGFRRSGNSLYRPACKSCNACIATRLDVDKNILKRGHKRILLKNADISINNVPTIDDDEYYNLYEEYINNRHMQGSMYPASKEQYQSFLFSDWNKSQFFEFRLNDRLIAVAVTDSFSNSLSAIYTFFSIDYPKRSLGIFAILSQLELTRLQNKKYLYLGYWLKNSPAMSYKGQFRPIECFNDNKWQELS